MAAPNLANISTITAKTTAAALGTTLTTDILTNLAASAKFSRSTPSWCRMWMAATARI